LTITGLYQWALSRKKEPAFADHVAWLLARKVMHEQNLEKDPYKVGSKPLSLRSEAAEFLEYRQDRPYNIPNVALGEILTHEYRILAIVANGQHEYTLDIGSGRLRHLRGISDAKSYVDIIWRLAAARRPRSFHQSSLPLIQTLDYLGYVLKDHPEWRVTQRLASGQEMQSVASIVLPVANLEEFGHRVSGMWNVLNELHVPKATKDELRKLGYSYPGTINCLEVWLDTWITTDLNRQTVHQAILDIKASRLVRNESIHLSEKARVDANAARKQLALPDIITDWAGTWEIITSRLAGAFDVIREEVQSATHVLASETGHLHIEDVSEQL